MTEKVGVYCRLSDEDRFKVNKNDDSNSIINQRSMCIKYACQFGWNVVDIYSDDDFSGAGTYRPDFERLIKDCESGKINLVLCKSQSRFSRDMEVIERYLHNKFIEWGVRFVSIIDNADTNIESNKKSRQINGLMNEWYLDDLAQNIKKSLKNKREDGLFMGSFAPYGYMRSNEDKHKLVIDPVSSGVIKKIFNLYVNGNGYHKICEYLNKNKIPTPAQYKKQNGSNFVCGSCDYDNVRWNPDTIAGILRNEVYIGTLVQGKRTSISYKVHKSKKVPKSNWCRVENAHEAIIDKSTWNQVQKILSNHTTPNKTGEIHILSGKVYCKECGKIFTRNVCNVKTEPTGKRAYLQCKGNKKLHICNNNRSMIMDELQQIILDEINKLLENFYDLDTLDKNYQNRKSNNNIKINEIQILETEKNNLDKKINENKNYYKKLYEDKVNGIVTEDMFKMLTKDYLDDIETMTKRISIINNEIESISKQQENKKKSIDILKKYHHIDSLNKVIIDEFIDKIYIGNYDNESKTRDIDIVWDLEF